MSVGNSSRFICEYSPFLLDETDEKKKTEYHDTTDAYMQNEKCCWKYLSLYLYDDYVSAVSLGPAFFYNYMYVYDCLTVCACMFVCIFISLKNKNIHNIGWFGWCIFFVSIKLYFSWNCIITAALNCMLLFCTRILPLCCLQWVVFFFVSLLFFFWLPQRTHPLICSRLQINSFRFYVLISDCCTDTIGCA